MASKVAVVFLGAVFPIIINTIAGIRDADQRLIQAARAFGASQLDIYVKVLVPGSLPAILLGIRLGIGRGLLSVIVGEMFVSEAGIGYQLMSYGQGMQIDKMLVYAFVVSIFGYAPDGLGPAHREPCQELEAESMTRFVERHQALLSGFVSFAVLLLIWQLAVDLGYVKAFFVSSPTRMARNSGASSRAVKPASMSP
jgi:ABC-type nitrate/sulfonate/bicarbonate transport system permease component